MAPEEPGRGAHPPAVPQNRLANGTGSRQRLYFRGFSSGRKQGYSGRQQSQVERGSADLVGAGGEAQPEQLLPQPPDLPLACR
jgi:hypothetical protein